MEEVFKEKKIEVEKSTNLKNKKKNRALKLNKKNKVRKDCILLPILATLEALNDSR